MKNSIIIATTHYISLQVMQFGDSLSCVLNSQYALEIFKLLCSVVVTIAVRHFEKKIEKQREKDKNISKF